MTIHCFVCDKPARSFIKGVKGHTGHWSCERCTIEGYTYNRTRIFPHNNCNLRTDATFRAMENAEHHKYRSPLLDIEPPIDMIKQFALDILHKSCLGDMKSFFHFLQSSKSRTRLNARARSKIDYRIRSIKNQLPKEFQRKPRPVGEYLRFKATEFYLFSVYIGILIFKNILTPDNYHHFLLLHCAIRILSSEDLCSAYSDSASKYLNKYFLASQVLYGLRSCTHNAHNNVHLADDVTNLKCNLLRSSAFCFEDTLEKLKKHIRTPYKPLSQLCRRLHEEKLIKKNKPQLPKNLEVLCDKFGKVKSFHVEGKYFFTSSRPNNCAMLSSGKIVFITKMFKVLDTLYLDGYVLKSLRPIYTYPFLQIWKYMKFRHGFKSLYHLILKKYQKK